MSCCLSLHLAAFHFREPQVPLVWWETCWHWEGWLAQVCWEQHAVSDRTRMFSIVPDLRNSQEDDKEIYIERKIHHEGWGGAKSAKERCLWQTNTQWKQEICHRLPVYIAIYIYILYIVVSSWLVLHVHMHRISIRCRQMQQHHLQWTYICQALCVGMVTTFTLLDQGACSLKKQLVRQVHMITLKPLGTHDYIPSVTVRFLWWGQG